LLPAELTDPLAIEQARYLSLKGVTARACRSTAAAAGGIKVVRV
jgi:hypothetical protein